jgi:hypothetical protein
MKTVPLFDDWLLDSHQDIVRRFGQPQLCPQKVVCEDGDTSVFPGGYINVIRDPESGIYKYWYPVFGQREPPIPQRRGHNASRTRRTTRLSGLSNK